MNKYSFIYWKLVIQISFQGIDLSVVHSQPAITCSKLTIETLEQGVKYVQS